MRVTAEISVELTVPGKAAPGLQWGRTLLPAMWPAGPGHGLVTCLLPDLRPPSSHLPSSVLPPLSLPGCLCTRRSAEVCPLALLRSVGVGWPGVPVPDPPLAPGCPCALVTGMAEQQGEQAGAPLS